MKAYIKKGWTPHGGSNGWFFFEQDHNKLTFAWAKEYKTVKGYLLRHRCDPVRRITTALWETCSASNYQPMPYSLGWK